MDREIQKLLIVSALFLAIFNVGEPIIFKIEGLSIIGNIGAVMMLSLIYFNFKKKK